MTKNAITDVRQVYASMAYLDLLSLYSVGSEIHILYLNQVNVDQYLRATHYLIVSLVKFCHCWSGHLIGQPKTSKRLSRNYESIF